MSSSPTSSTFRLRELFAFGAIEAFLGFPLTGVDFCLAVADAASSFDGSAGPEVAVSGVVPGTLQVVAGVNSALVAAGVGTDAKPIAVSTIAGGVVVSMEIAETLVEAMGGRRGCGSNNGTLVRS